MGRHRRLCQWTGCRQYANLLDLDTEQTFCLGCALAMLHAADDPIVNFREFDDTTEYTDAIARHPSIERLMQRRRS
ncbi:hypothetical protein ACFY00_25605 [Kitasatospora sp. NPDC001540]|uniref:hypothetical protein n=1 Tax=Kitasatospora sp. NPDC001540 TaxID=3364014 RepID=UPI0036CD0B72